MAARKSSKQDEANETASPFGGLVFTANVVGEFELKVKEQQKLTDGN